MKKLISLISILCLVTMLFCSCGKKIDDADATSTNLEASTSQTTVIDSLESASQGVDEVVMNEIDESEAPIDGDAEIVTSNSSNKNNNSSSSETSSTQNSSSADSSSSDTASLESSSTSSANSSSSSIESIVVSSDDNEDQDVMHGTPWQ